MEFQLDICCEFLVLRGLKNEFKDMLDTIICIIIIYKNKIIIF